MYKLYVKQKVFKILDHYPVLDENGEEVYRVDQELKLFGHKLCVQKKDGTKSFMVQKRLFTLLPQYDVTFNDGNSLYIKQNFTFFKREIILSSHMYHLQLIGHWWDMNFDVESQGQVVGSIDKKWLSWGDCFEITVYDARFEEELIALMLVVDAVKDVEDTAHSGR